MIFFFTYDFRTWPSLSIQQYCHSHSLWGNQTIDPKKKKTIPGILPFRITTMRFWGAFLKASVYKCVFIISIFSKRKTGKKIVFWNLQVVIYFFQSLFFKNTMGLILSFSNSCLYSGPIFHTVNICTRKLLGILNSKQVRVRITPNGKGAKGSRMNLFLLPNLASG